MTIKHEIRVDKENKVLTLLVHVPRKKTVREPNLSFNDSDAWEAVENYRIVGYKVKYSKNGLVVDNWRLCNHEGTFVFSLEEKKQAKPRAKAKVAPRSTPKLKNDDEKPTRKPKTTRIRRPPAKKFKKPKE
jgi:hypothetical protein